MAQLKTRLAFSETDDTSCTFDAKYMRQWHLPHAASNAHIHEVHAAGNDDLAATQLGISRTATRLFDRAATRKICPRRSKLFRAVQAG